MSSRVGFGTPPRVADAEDLSEKGQLTDLVLRTLAGERLFLPMSPVMTPKPVRPVAGDDFFVRAPSPLGGEEAAPETPPPPPLVHRVPVLAEALLAEAGYRPSTGTEAILRGLYAARGQEVPPTFVEDRSLLDKWDRRGR